MEHTEIAYTTTYIPFSGDTRVQDPRCSVVDWLFHRAVLRCTWLEYNIYSAFSVRYL